MCKLEPVAASSQADLTALPPEGHASRTGRSPLQAPLDAYEASAGAQPEKSHGIRSWFKSRPSAGAHDLPPVLKAYVATLAVSPDRPKAADVRDAKLRWAREVLIHAERRESRTGKPTRRLLPTLQALIGHASPLRLAYQARPGGGLGDDTSYVRVTLPSNDAPVEHRIYLAAPANGTSREAGALVYALEPLMVEGRSLLHSWKLAGPGMRARTDEIVLYLTACSPRELHAFVQRLKRVVGHIVQGGVGPEGTTLPLGNGLYYAREVTGGHDYGAPGASSYHTLLAHWVVGALDATGWSGEPARALKALTKIMVRGGVNPARPWDLEFPRSLPEGFFPSP